MTVLRVELERRIRLQVHAYLAEDTMLERGGFLLGGIDRSVGVCTRVTNFIACPDAPSSSVSLTLRPDDWQLAHAHPEMQAGRAVIVGWVHSHPAMPVTMSSRDMFIQRHFFSDECQIAWIRDPIGDAEAIWRLVRGRAERACLACAEKSHE